MRTDNHYDAYIDSFDEQPEEIALERADAFGLMQNYADIALEIEDLHDMHRELERKQITAARAKRRMLRKSPSE